MSNEEFIANNARADRLHEKGLYWRGDGPGKLDLMSRKGNVLFGSVVRVGGSWVAQFGSDVIAVRPDYGSAMDAIEAHNEVA